MPWRKTIPQPIVLTDGRVLEQLRDIREVLIQPDMVRDPAALRALELMLQAAETGNRADIEAAVDQAAFVLAQHKLLA